jgi:hypothetical protein
MLFDEVGHGLRLATLRTLLRERLGRGVARASRRSALTAREL